MAANLTLKEKYNIFKYHSYLYTDEINKCSNFCDSDFCDSDFYDSDFCDSNFCDSDFYNSDFYNS